MLISDQLLFFLNVPLYCLFEYRKFLVVTRNILEISIKLLMHISVKGIETCKCLSFFCIAFIFNSLFFVVFSVHFNSYLKNRKLLSLLYNCFFFSTQITSITEDQDDLMDIDDPIRDESHRPSFPALPSRTINPFPLPGSDIARSAFDGGLDLSSTGHLVSRRREVRQIPVVVNDSSEQSSHSGLAPTGENSTETANRQGSEIHDTVIIDDEDEENILPAPVTRGAPSYVQVASSGPSAPMMNDLPDYRNDIEEEMVRAAIEASKRDCEISYSDQNTSVPAIRQSVGEDPELAHAVSLSLKVC